MDELELEGSEQATEVEGVEGEPGDQANDETTELGADEQAVEKRYLPVDDWADAYVTVVVDGEEVELPVSEALQGVMRQQDYTRKTQSIAQERERLTNLARLEEWLKEDPEGTIKALSRAYGLGAAEDEGEDEDLDPAEKRLRQLEAREAAREAAAREAAINAEADAALSQHGLKDATRDDLLQFALDNRIGNLAAAARLLKAERLEETQRNQRAEIVTKKRAAAVVEGGATRRPDATVPAKAKKMSLRESYVEANKQHGRQVA